MLRFGDGPFSLRTEVRLRKAFDSGDRDFNDIIGIVGLQYTFGGGSSETRAVPLADEAPADPRDLRPQRRIIFPL